jgi:menaquinone-9 beta-reductase
MSNYDVIIAGGGPAGSSAAIHLATRGLSVLLAEQKKFPRAKLCGEFISPECAIHFEQLGVSHEMLAAHPAHLTETVFYSRRGNRVRIPSSWFGSNQAALGLSRAEMDERLLRRAADCGVEVLEDAQVSSLVIEDGRVRGAKVKTQGHESSFRATITIDATGRKRALARSFEKTSQPAIKNRNSLVAFKAHLRGALVEPGACEIYFYHGGYGGLSSIEGGLSNLCFIAAARDVRACNADADQVMRKVVCQNARAAETLAKARAESRWLAVALDSFGRHKLAPTPGLISIGDAASFIDPFTGSGMLMALESGELAAQIIAKHAEADSRRVLADQLAAEYRQAYSQKFDSRLRLCSMLRRAAFVPGLAGTAIRLFGLNARLRQRVTKATRSQAQESSFPLTG